MNPSQNNTMELTSQEKELITALRQWEKDNSGKENLGLTIEWKYGAWEIAYLPQRDAHYRGIGQTFGEAWDDMNSSMDEGGIFDQGAK